MRITNVLNISLLVLVLAMCAASVGAYFIVSDLHAELEISKQADAVGQEISRLDDALQSYRSRDDVAYASEIDEIIASVGRSIDHLRELPLGPAIAAELDRAIEPYAGAFGAYVKQQKAKAQALEVMDRAVSSVKAKAIHEAAQIEREHGEAQQQAAEIEDLQARSFETANMFAEVMIAISRMRQAAARFAMTGEEGAHRTAEDVITQIRATIDRLTGRDPDLAKSRRFKVFNRWFETYARLYQRVPMVDALSSPFGERVDALNKAAAPLQAEADRLRTQIQKDFLLANRRANVVRGQLKFMRQRTIQLAAMRQSLQGALSLTPLLGEAGSMDLQRLSEDMRNAVDRLERDVDRLASMADQVRAEGTREGERSDPRMPSVILAVDDLKSAWRAAVDATSEQRKRAQAMSKAAMDATTIVQQTIRAVDRDFARSLDNFMIFVMVIAPLFLTGSLIGALVIYRYMTRPLAEITTSMSGLAGGNLSMPIPDVRTGADLKALADAAEIFRKSSLERIELERVNAEKERRLVQERADALEDSLRAEQEKMQLQRKFVAMVCHEFRTPLAIIDGQAQGIRKRIDRLEQEAILGRLDKVSVSVQRLVSLMESMLASSRLEAGTTAFNPDSHDLRTLVLEVCSNQGELAPSHHVDVDVGALPRNHFSDCDLIRQVITNVLSNAVKYSPEANRIEVRGTVDAEEVRIDVRDFGPGIPEDELSKLGTQFFRASTSTGIPGTGIGLYLINALLKMHDGSLTIASKVGEGSTFSIHLPHRTARQAA